MGIYAWDFQGIAMTTPGHRVIFRSLKHLRRFEGSAPHRGDHMPPEIRPGSTVIDP
jgi:hypothetical protein